MQTITTGYDVAHEPQIAMRERGISRICKPTGRVLGVARRKNGPVENTHDRNHNGEKADGSKSHTSILQLHQVIYIFLQIISKEETKKRRNKRRRKRGGEKKRNRRRNVSLPSTLNYTLRRPPLSATPRRARFFFFSSSTSLSLSCGI